MEYVFDRIVKQRAAVIEPSHIEMGKDVLNNLKKYWKKKHEKANQYVLAEEEADLKYNPMIYGLPVKEVDRPGHIRVVSARDPIANIEEKHGTLDRG